MPLPHASLAAMVASAWQSPSFWVVLILLLTTWVIHACDPSEISQILLILSTLLVIFLTPVLLKLLVLVLVFV
jgi:hypothetical protein